MTRPHHPTALQMIPVDQIVVLNPRDRNSRVFEEIVGNIKKIGLKKPVTVTPRDDLEDGKRYLLICVGAGVNPPLFAGEVAVLLAAVDAA